MALDSQLQLLVLVVLAIVSSVVGAVTVNSTVLVFAKDSASAYSVTSGFNGYGIP